MKIKKENICNFGVLLIVLVAFTKSFYKTIYGGNTGVLLVLIIACILMTFGIKKNKIKLNLLTILWILISIVALYNNYDLKHNNILAAVQIIVGTIMVILLTNNSIWCKQNIKYIKFFSLFYMITGLILLFAKNILISKIVPLFDVNGYYYKSILSQINSGYMTGLTSHYSIMGIYLSIGLCFFAGNIYNDSGKIEFKQLLGIIFMLIGTYLSGKRSALLFPLAAVLITYVLYFRPQNLNRKVNYLLFSFVIIIIAGLLMSTAPKLNGALSRLASIIGSDNTNEITNKRYEMLWEPAIKLFEENKQFGIGWGNFKYSFTKYYKLNANQNNTHNVYLQLLCETGIFGTIIVLGTMMYTLYRTGFWMRKWRKGIVLIDNQRLSILGISFTMQIYFLLYSLTGNPLYDIHAYLPYMISIAMSIAIDNELRIEKKEKN